MMLFLQKIQNSDSLGYFYTPENYPGPGIVEIEPLSREVHIVELSSFDKKEGHPYFASIARGKVKQMWDQQDLPDEKFFAWG